MGQMEQLIRLKELREELGDEIGEPPYNEYHYGLYKLYIELGIAIKEIENIKETP